MRVLGQKDTGHKIERQPQAEAVGRAESTTGPRRYKLSKKLVVTKDIHPGFMLVYNLRRGSIRRCSSTFWRALRFENRCGGYVAWRPELKDLVRDKFLVPLGVDEQKDTLQDKLRTLKNRETRKLYWSIWPTANCNLACDYCGQNHSNIKLSREHCDLTVQLIRRRLAVHGFKKLHVSWFGGEPLMGLQVMRYLTPRLFKAAKELGVPYDSRVITNGTLLSKRVGRELMHQMGVVWIDVTLDGPGEVHDKRRFTRGGKGTYDRIIQNLQDFFEIRKSKQQTALTIRCNVDVRNGNAAKELVDELASLGFQNEIGRLHFAAVFPWGEASRQRHRFKDQKKYAKLNLEISRHAISKGFNTWILPLGAGTGCSVAGLNTTVNVSPSGRLYRCGEVPLTDTYERQKMYRWWDMGTLEQLSEQNEEEIVFSSDWYEELSRGRWPCMDCSFFGVCSGECPRQHRDGYTPCPQYVRNMRDRMRAYSQLSLPTPEHIRQRSWFGPLRSKVASLFRPKALRADD